MRPKDESISPSGRAPARPTPPNAFALDFLADIRGRDESLTASEAEYAGPWKLEPVPGHPGAVAVLRACESLAEGDEPVAVFLEEETARICIAILPGVERDLYHLHEDGDPEGLVVDGLPFVTNHGEERPRVRGWLRHYHPEIVRDIQTVELLNRNPAAHAAVLEAGGGGALERIGRELAARRR